MRIIAGKHRGTQLADVGKGDADAHLRPTSDRVRESLFSMLTHHNVINGARVLDLFAGTGALGLEALSRGAREVVFIENGRVGQKLITENIKKLLKINNKFYSSAPISVAIGAGVSEEGESIEAVIRRADLLMYARKQEYYDAKRKAGLGNLSAA